VLYNFKDIINYYIINLPVIQLTQNQKTKPFEKRIEKNQYKLMYNNCYIKQVLYALKIVSCKNMKRLVRTDNSFFYNNEYVALKNNCNRQ